MSYMKSRQRKFDMWWKKNHHKKQGQVWLCKSAKRIAFAYNLHPSAFDDVRFICKRFFSSEHMRLRKEDAWKLYKLCNPLHTERLKRLQTTAEHLDALKRESGDGLQHPLWIGKPKPKQKLLPTSKDILDAIRNRRLVYEHYVDDYNNVKDTRRLAEDILQKTNIVELVESAVLFGINNHDKYGDQTEDVITSAPLSLLFRILEDLDIAVKDSE
jgi:hypothetical protein